MIVETQRTLRRHLLLPKEILAKLPPLYSNEEKQESEIVIPVKFFGPYNNWRWFPYEYDPEEGLFFGLVQGFEIELGYFTFQELEQAKAKVFGTFLPAVERDIHWGPMMLADVRDKLERTGYA